MKTHLMHLFFFFATILSFASAITLPYQSTPKPRQTKFSSTTTEPGSGSLVTPASVNSDQDTASFRLLGKNGETCILLQSDCIVEVKFLLHGFEEQADSYLPKDALVDGECSEDFSSLSLSWKGYQLKMNFAKTPGGERWYVKNIKLIVSPDLPQLRGIQAHDRSIKLYHREMIIPTPIGKSYSCSELDVEIKPASGEETPPGLRGALLFRKFRLQPFMYKSENFEEPFECKPEMSFRDETAPIAVGSTLAIAVLMTVTGYGIFRYFKIKNVQYNTME